MSTTTQRPASLATSGSLRLGSTLMAVAGLAFIGYAVIFLELGIGPNQIAAGRDEIKAFDPNLFNYISHLHIAVSGFIAATGLATAGLAWFGVRRGQVWAYVTAVATPVIGLAVAVPAHYPYHFDTLGHLGLIYLATAIFVIGAALALRPLMAQNRP
jgi:hypothetical protein